MSIVQDTAQVCENDRCGQFVRCFSVFSKHDFCPSCGAKTQTKCIQCDTPIQGGVRHLGLTDPDTGEQHTILREHVESIPDYCPKCGQKFPWAGKQPDSSPHHTISSTPIIINNSPGTKVSVGSGNIHQETAWVKQFEQRIEKTSASDEEKQKAKSLLTQISENKLVNSVISAISGEVTKAALPK